jgi:hypothetical protein
MMATRYILAMFGGFALAAVLQAQTPRPLAVLGPPTVVPDSAPTVTRTPAFLPDPPPEPSVVPASMRPSALGAPGDASPYSQCRSPVQLPDHWTEPCPCGPSGCFWVDGQYLLWATHGSPLPPLVTGAPPTSAAPVPGALGNPDTVLLYGNGQVNNGLRSGFRVDAGFWLDDAHTWGMDASFFYLDPTSNGFDAASKGTNVSLFRPIFNTITGAPGVEDVASLKDGIVGQVGVLSRTLFLGGDLNLFRPLCCSDECGCGYRVNVFAGYRILALTESLEVQENLTTLDLAGAPNGTILVDDRFRTTNVFQGGQLGVAGEWWQGNWFVGVRGLIALGDTHQSVDINGLTVTQATGGPPVLLNGGLLALPTNIGHYTRDVFTVSPAGSVKVGYSWNDHVRTWIGYDIIYWSSVVRPGNQVDLVVNPNAVPPPIGPPFTPARPSFTFNGSEFWVQGVSFGLELLF